MLKRKDILSAIILSVCALPAFGANNELAKIQSQIKETEIQNKKIEAQLRTSSKNVEQTKKQLVRAADKVSNLEEQRGALIKRIAELDKQRDKINAELTKSYDGITDATASMLFISSNPNFDAATMHEYVLASVVLAAASDKLSKTWPVEIFLIRDICLRPPSMDPQALHPHNFEVLFFTIAL